MKMNANILEKLKEKEYRAGIDRITVDSTFFKGLRVLYILFFIWNIGVNALYCIATLSEMSNQISLSGGWNKLSTALQDDFTGWRMRVIYIIALSVLLIFGLFSMIKKWHWSSLFFNIAPATAISIELGIAASKAAVEVNFWKMSYTYVNLLPLALMALLCLWYCAAGLVHDISLKRAYNKFVNQLYMEHSDKFDKLSDEEWEKFLSSYQYEKPQNKKENRKKNKK